MNTPTGVAPADAGVPNRTTRIAPPSAAVKAKDNFNLSIMAAVLIAASALCFYTQHSVAGYILGGLSLVLLSSLFAKKSDVGQCPFCMAQFRETVSVKNELLRCEQCGEYSGVQ